MKSILFNIENKDIKNEENTDDNSATYPYLIKINIPLLPAYSVEYITISVNGVVDLTSYRNISGKEISVYSQYKIEETFNVDVILYYHGIRDYSLLFPWIQNPELRERVGYYHEEADKNFESASWLSFAIMCGAIFEGVLTAKSVKGENFGEKIENAYQNGLLNAEQKVIFHKVRKFRNAVHANRYNDTLIKRIDAMDIKNTLNMIIKSFV